MATASHRPFTKSKTFIVLVILAVLIIAIKIIIPPIILKKTNKYLGEFNPEYSLHIDKMKLSLLRGAYKFVGIEGKLKDESRKEFLHVNAIDVSIAWREIFKGRMVSDIEIEEPKIILIKDMKRLVEKKKETDEAKNRIFPLKVERLDIKDGKLTVEAVQSFTDKKHLSLDHINGRVTNLTPGKKSPLTFFNLSTNIVDPDNKFKFTGELDTTKKPMVIDMDAEIRNFNLTLLNPYLKNHIPLTFTKGTMDAYSELFSKDGVMKGYVKPFMRELDVVASKEKFKNAKQVGLEMITAMVNLILREKKTKSVATIIEFTYDKKFEFKPGKVVKKAIEHGFEQQLAPGIEDRYHLN